mgnify:CR=1 FL=1
MKHIYLIIISAVFFTSCSQTGKQGNSEKQPIQESPGPKLEMLWESDTLLTTSESVLYDETNDILYVSCINGVPPTAQDEDGFIAKISPKDGKIIDEKWITGLDAPKGMGLFENKLYVTNIDEIWTIDIESGEVIEKTTVDSAQFLNDITVDDTGNVYFSDSGTDKIHLLDTNGELSTWLVSKELGRPNGLLHNGDRLMLATSGAGTFNYIKYNDKMVNLLLNSIPSGDGVVKVGDDYLVSNWNGEVYFVNSKWEKTKLLDTKDDGKNTADIEFNQKEMILYIPTFFGNQVAAYKLEK